jgi:hypothetical protein
MCIVHDTGQINPWIFLIMALLATWFTLFSCLAYSSTLNMEAICFSETSADFQQATWRYIPEDGTLPWISKLGKKECLRF